MLNIAYADDSIKIKSQEVNSLGKESESFYSNWVSVLPMILIFVVFYFLLIKPQEKRRKQQEELVKSVKKGEEVVTNAGIFGIITKINDSENTVVLEVDNNINIKIMKNTILDIVSRRGKK